MIIDSQEVDSREQKLIDYINDFKGLYKEYDSKEKLSREMGFFSISEREIIHQSLMNQLFYSKKHMRFDNPNRVQGITTNYVYNPYFCSSGASLTWWLGIPKKLSMEVLRTPWEYRFRVRDVISWMLSKKIVVLVAGPAA